MKKRRTHSKACSKGQLSLEGILLVVMLFGFAIVAVIGYKVLSEFNDEIQADPSMSNESKAVLQNVDNNYPSTLDTAFTIFLFLFWIVLLVSSFFIDTHPVFFIVTIILLVVTFLVAMIISNTYQDVMSEAEFTTFADDFPVMSWVMENLLIVIMVIGISTGVALYAKSQA